jgi:hypothetical protein
VIINVLGPAVVLFMQQQRVLRRPNIGYLRTLMTVRSALVQLGARVGLEPGQASLLHRFMREQAVYALTALGDEASHPIHYFAVLILLGFLTLRFS